MGNYQGDRQAEIFSNPIVQQVAASAPVHCPLQLSDDGCSAAVQGHCSTAALQTLQSWLLALGPGHTKPETINQRWLVLVVTGQIVQTTAALQHPTCSHRAADPLLP